MAPIKALKIKLDLVDREGFQTITLVLAEPHIAKYVAKLEVDSFVRVEGSVVLDKNAADGGSAKYSLHVDATTSIIKVEPFDVTLVFMPEISIQNFLAKLLGDPSIKGTLAFVVLQVDRAKRNVGGEFNQLTIANGPEVINRATLSFINGRRADFNKLVEEFEAGNVVMYVARNVGVWKEKSNTLSIFDITILTHVYGDRLRNSLLAAFHSQIHEMGYGQEVIGTFTISNFNDALVAKKYALCKDSKINQISEGGYCFACGKAVDIVLSPCVEGTITHEHSGVATSVRLGAGIVDCVLQFEDSFINLYHQNPILLKVALSEVEAFGKFFVDNKAQVVSYVPQV